MNWVEASFCMDTSESIGAIFILVSFNEPEGPGPSVVCRPRLASRRGQPALSLAGLGPVASVHSFFLTLPATSNKRRSDT